ncbi:MAG TPA: hypothetical protein VHK65_09410 [Candidatus Dormibacteraeota bacterium]|nr:hypothetical protein [Candidatus Dormibacteraeota bacterium]
MRISSVQQGLIVENEFAKFLMVGSGGKIELAKPMSDDERRDYEIHIRGEYGMGFACQVKSAMSLHKMSKNVRYINIFFDVAVERLVNSPFYWYFVAYLDPKSMGLADPTFLIPSEDFHRLAAPIQRSGMWRFSMAANMEAKSRDRWNRYRVGTLELGERVLEISRELRRTHPRATLPARLLAMPDVMLVRPK